MKNKMNDIKRKIQLHVQKEKKLKGGRTRWTE